LSNCLATVLASRPRRWPLPSMVICIIADIVSNSLYIVHSNH
jgi:hypothetical protein